MGIAPFDLDFDNLTRFIRAAPATWTVPSISGASALERASAFHPRPIDQDAHPLADLRFQAPGADPRLRVHEARAALFPYLVRQRPGQRVGLGALHRE